MMIFWIFDMLALLLLCAWVSFSSSSCWLSCLVCLQTCMLDMLISDMFLSMLVSVCLLVLILNIALYACMLLFLFHYGFAEMLWWFLPSDESQFWGLGCFSMLVCLFACSELDNVDVFSCLLLSIVALWWLYSEGLVVWMLFGQRLKARCLTVCLWIRFFRRLEVWWFYLVVCWYSLYV